MTGGGASSAAFVVGDGYGSIPGAPTYYLPRDVRVQNLNLQNQLQRMREPGTAEAVDSIAGNLEGAVAIQSTLNSDIHTNIRSLVFNSGGSSFTSGPHSTSRWFLGCSYLDNVDTTSTVERELRECIPLQYQIDYQQGQNTVTQTLTMAFGDERKNTSITPSSLTKPSDGNDVPFHGVDWQVDSTTVDKLQSLSLRFQGPLYRYHRDPSRTPVAATLARPQVEVDARAIYNSDSELEHAYGSTGSTQPQDSIDSLSGTATFSKSDGTTVATYSFSELKPNTYEWSDLITADTDLTDPITYHANGGVSVS